MILSVLTRLGLRKSGMTYSIMPLGGLLAGAIAELVGTPAAVAMGGRVVSAFAAGPSAMNKRVLDLSLLLGEGDHTHAAQTAAKA